MFFHIPLFVFFLSSQSSLFTSSSFRPEAYGKADPDPRTNKPLDVGVHDQEGPGNAKGNDGFFQKGLQQAMESEHVSKNALEVKVVGNGHCHRM